MAVTFVDSTAKNATTQAELAGLLRLAYSAEHAATLAYLGHAASVASASERAEILKIADEEIAHRANLLRMLQRLGLRPSHWYEFKYAVIGKLIGWSCRLIGRFMPMYFAGRLESGNVNEYLRMAKLCAESAIADELPCIDEMGIVEKRHELYFLGKVLGHRLLPVFTWVFRWGPGASFNPMGEDFAVEKPPT